MLNDPQVNSAIDRKLREMRNRADQQPVSYLALFREAADLAEEQFRRAMLAEASLSKAYEIMREADQELYAEKGDYHTNSTLGQKMRIAKR